ncbi:uncharacterized protein LOC114935056 [Nylanderia fulva]|uniref:uncharacterized protein LOC114935056 n=1 Tax=Nylanderia fulva TaxID=613905 RepID=UPI0010FB4B42|nr:uncharacterized protein LOC114935056 [Nylanderia fulva]
MMMMTTMRDGRVEVTLLTARAKVASVKKQSVPCLELCGAVLVARLLHRVAHDLDLEDVPVVAWTDARVVLCWLRSHASRWRPFVAHRVAEVQSLVPGERWRHVPTASNPADVATRGIPVSELLGLDLWWRGPVWLRGPTTAWPVVGDLGAHHEEEEKRAVHLAVPENPEDLFEGRFSTLTRFVRVVVYCYRFYHKARGMRDQSDFLSGAELEVALSVMVRRTQRREFPGELGALTAGGLLPGGSSLRALSPFLDEDGSLRVGGRLQSAHLPFSEKHPNTAERGLLYRAGPSRRAYGDPAWRPSTHAELSSPSLLGRGGGHSGPKDRPGLRALCPLPRGTSATKDGSAAAGAPTRAVHLEAVSDLSTPAFIAAFRRFIARRGRCRLLLSDNATNFRGADAELRARFRAASDFYKRPEKLLTWRPLGSRDPFGQASSAPHSRDHALTYEELLTLLCQIEACLNSRPLSPLSADATDLVALTPGHFLVGEALGTIPEVPVSDLHPTSRWRLISAIKESFWNDGTKSTCINCSNAPNGPESGPTLRRACWSW